MLDETSYLIEQSRGLTKAQFVEDETLKRAFVRSIEVIGEASKKLPEETRRKYPQVEWRAVAGMRDRLIHGYFETDYDIVWDVVVNRVPTLQQEVVSIVREESEGSTV
jgi:uncharacterized protein with HEPN domain